MIPSRKQIEARSHNYLMWRCRKEINQLKMLLHDMKKHPTVTDEANEIGQELLDKFQEFFVILGTRRK